jgi:hypothetical protein
MPKATRELGGSDDTVAPAGMVCSGVATGGRPFPRLAERAAPYV